jgi:hypothetical protein
MGRFTIRNPELILAMSVSIYETVKAALENDDRQNVKYIEADLSRPAQNVSAEQTLHKQASNGVQKLSIILLKILY